MTKTLTIAAMIASMATVSFAGSLETVVEPEPQADVFVANPSSGGLALPLAIAGGVIALAAVAADSDGDDAAATTTTMSDGDDSDD